MTRIFMGVVLAMGLFLSAGQARAALTLSYPVDSHTIPPAGGTDLMQVFCPAGTVVVSGGWNANAGQGQYLMVWVSRQIGNSWRIMTVNTHPTSSMSITGYAVCASGINGLSSYSVTAGPVNVPAFSEEVSYVSCTNGGIPTGGGFDSNFPDPNKLVPTKTKPATSAGVSWSTTEVNVTNTAKTFTAYATCTKNLNGTVTERATPLVSIPANSWAATSVDCPVGDYAIGGGYITGLDFAPTPSMSLVRTFGNLPTSSNSSRWIAKVFNSNAAVVAGLTPYADCLHLN
jgi:hypothetical protein